MSTPAAPQRPLRRDAERNRQRILQGARECFAARGLGVSLDDIARHSEVGVGTVYRRFPTKQVLVDALFEEHLERVAGILEAGIEHADPWTGFAEALERILEMQACDRGLMQLIVGGAHGGEGTARARERFAPLGHRLVERARAQGVLRDDVRHTDVPLLQVMLGSLIDATRDVDPQVWRRYLQIVLDGLRAQRPAPTALPADPLGEDAVERALRGWRPSGCTGR